ncbi:MAG: 23S rRNA (adenine(2030)-N(6))-methyltransferase RlmJ, partial [Pseudomonadota bacterium]
HKHAILVALLARLTAKSKPLTYVETHAGRGVYQLDGSESSKTGEAQRGVSRLRADAPAWAEPLLDAIGSAPAYRGSPAIAAHLTRPDDRLLLMELHPAEHAALARHFADDPRAACHKRDAFEGLLALTPPMPRRGLVLIDPSYELAGSYDETVAAVVRLRARWPQAVVAVWYPLLTSGLGETLRAALVGSAAEAADAWWHEVTFAAPQLAARTGSQQAAGGRQPRAEGTRSGGRDGKETAGRGSRGKGMGGSGMVVLNPPWQWAQDTASLLADLSGFLANQGEPGL